MIKLKSETIDWLSQIYAVSNTPSYLYRRYRADKTVENLAKTYTPEELLNCIFQIDNKNNLTLEDVVTAYAATVGLTFHDIKFSINMIKHVQFQKLEWVQNIINVWEETRIPAQLINLRNKPKIGEHNLPVQDVTEENIDIRPQPELNRINLFSSDSPIKMTRHKEKEE
jgi:hypothetical protein